MIFLFNIFYKTEFLARIDKIIVFNPLSESNLAKIAELQLKEFGLRLQAKKFKIIYDKSLPKLIGRISRLPEQGARAIRKNILEYIENPIAKKLLAAKPKKVIKVLAKDGKIVVE